MNFSKQKYIVLTGLLASIAEILTACPVCERNQPKMLKGIVHGAGPASQWDYLIMWVVIAITVVTFYYSVKWLIRPGEKNINHIKYSILNEE